MIEGKFSVIAKYCCPTQTAVSELMLRIPCCVARFRPLRSHINPKRYPILVKVTVFDGFTTTVVVQSQSR